MRYIFLLLSFLIVKNAYAELSNTGNNFSSFIGNLKTAHVDFIQTKTIPNLSRQFQSSGKIKFIKDKGFIWHQSTPNDFIFISTPEQYCTKDESRSLSGLPHYSDFSELIDNVLNHDYTQLKNTFDITYKEEGNNWNLHLSPKITELSDIFKQITVKGDLVQISEVEFQYQNGSIVTIKFFLSKAKLSDEIKC